MYFCTYDKLILFSKSLFLEDKTFLQLQPGIEKSAESSKQQKSEIIVCVMNGLCSGYGGEPPCCGEP